MGTETKYIMELHTFIHNTCIVPHHLVAREHDVCTSYVVAAQHGGREREERGRCAATAAAGAGVSCDRA